MRSDTFPLGHRPQNGPDALSARLSGSVSALIASDPTSKPIMSRTMLTGHTARSLARAASRNSATVRQAPNHCANAHTVANRRFSTRAFGHHIWWNHTFMNPCRDHGRARGQGASRSATALTILPNTAILRAINRICGDRRSKRISNRASQACSRGSTKHCAK